MKDIRLSPKKNGKGYTTSYSVNIGSGEAKEAGLVDRNGTPVPLIKTVLPGRIIFEVK